MVSQFLKIAQPVKFYGRPALLGKPKAISKMAGEAVKTMYE
jgi:hypothetical protein